VEWQAALQTAGRTPFREVPAGEHETGAGSSCGGFCKDLMVEYFSSFLQ